jgi:EmrB/QacA subfamily drug resistance transporter
MSETATLARVVDVWRSSSDPDAIQRRRWWTLAALCLSLTVITMDNTILNVAIPRLVSDLGATSSQLQWIVDSYTIVFAGLLLTAGSLGDRFGRKRLLTAGIAVFLVGSVASALQHSATGLIFTRGFMGIGGAMIMPSTLSILTNVFRDPKERGRAIGIWAGVSSLAVALGPLAGGTLLAHFSWSSVFWINVPIGLTAIVVGQIVIPESKDPSDSRPDPLGAILSIVGMGAVLYGIIEVPVVGWGANEVRFGLSAGIVVIAAFVLWELFTPNPMLPITLYRNRRFSAANAAITLAFLGLFSTLFLMTQYWQFVHGYTPLQVGVRLIPYAFVMMAVSPVSPHLVERIGTKSVMVMGMLIMGASMFTMSFIGVHSSYVRVIINMSITAIGLSLALPTASASIMGALPRERAGVGSAVNDTTRQLGGALGIAIIGSVAASGYSHQMNSATSRFGLTAAQTATAKSGLGNALSQIAPKLPAASTKPFVEAARQSFVHGFASGLRIGALVMVISAAVTYAFLPGFASEPANLPREEPVGALLD